MWGGFRKWAYEDFLPGLLDFFKRFMPLFLDTLNLFCTHANSNAYCLPFYVDSGVKYHILTDFPTFCRVKIANTCTFPLFLEFVRSATTSTLTTDVNILHRTFTALCFDRTDILTGERYSCKCSKPVWQNRKQTFSNRTTRLIPF